MGLIGRIIQIVGSVDGDGKRPFLAPAKAGERWLSEAETEGRGLEQFHEKCVPVLRPELRKNKEIEGFAVSMKR